MTTKSRKITDMTVCVVWLDRSLCSNRKHFIGQLSVPFKFPHSFFLKKKKNFIEVYYRDIVQFKWFLKFQLKQKKTEIF
jgi:hypothetical protein